MVFPRDSETGSELSNTSFTENGFTLDLAQSHYLDIDVRKSVFNAETNVLTEDTRFNKPAADGQTYTDEGVYTITVTNRYTDEKTKKVIYVGTNDVLKAYAATGLPIKDIESQLADGATIARDGSLLRPGETDTTQRSESGNDQNTNDEASTDSDKDITVDRKDSSQAKHIGIPVILAVFFCILAIGVIIFLLVRKKRKTFTSNSSNMENPNAPSIDMEQ
ncbi:hypothetical protein BLEM_2054 [Bifidobacterium lemurum]|uniref:Uncharacterized protein n=2 Tax=Bifidobacterium lemurum TaxID=1603886 RepID=A0A261FLT8_9BIFI|nr:hypothetical protein [Bifidobacterium lemurum]OZG60114.1 hypothetical protein BLEM_2054 [Bifidobacterium lemurum]